MNTKNKKIIMFLSFNVVTLHRIFIAFQTFSLEQLPLVIPTFSSFMGDVSINNLRVFAQKRAVINIQKLLGLHLFYPKINKPILCCNGLFSVGPN